MPVFQMIRADFQFLLFSAMGLKVHCGARTESIVGTDGSTDNESAAPVSALKFSNEGWDDLDVQMVSLIYEQCILVGLYITI